MRVAGVDGCRGGWAIAHLADGRVSFEVAPDFNAVLAATQGAAIVAVDMPIGLPAHVGPGGRGPDAAARRVLGARQSSIFAVPSRAAVLCADYRDACAAALATSDPPRKVSKQCFHLFPKMREIDAVMTPALQSRIVETHPETAFWAMNDKTPLALPKRVKSQPHAPGLALRLSLLERAGATLGPYAPKTGIVAADDFVDAAACAVAALRVQKGEAMRFPAAAERDEKGLRMEIWA